MDAALYTKMLSDKNVTDLRKLGCKYPDADMKEFINLLKTGVYKTVPIPDFAGNDLVYMENVTQVRMSAVRLLLTPQSSSEAFGLKAMEEEIEERIYGMKKGLEFISDPANEITEENIHLLYDTAIGRYLPEEDQLRPGSFYRHDNVYILSQKPEHTGLPHEKLPEYLGRLISFIHAEDTMNDLLKAAVIHFYIAYLHPYFDGNGLMARLMQLWCLRRQGYSSALFVPFSSYVERSRKGYYNAFSLAENNAKISGVMGVTPFLVYFIENVYNRFDSVLLPQTDTAETFRKALDDGKITEKEKDLWNFVLSAYGGGEFSTKRLERDFGNAAYATIRSFVLKFEELGLLTAQKYGNKVKYSVGGNRHAVNR